MRTRHRTQYPGIFFRLDAKGKRRYIVWYSDEEGEHTQTLPADAGLEDARLLKGQLESRRANGETVLRSRKTINELLDEHLSDMGQRLDETTMVPHRAGVALLKKEFGSKKVTELSATDVARWITKMQRGGKAASTIRRYLSPLSSAYRVAVRDGLVVMSPTDKLLPHERPTGERVEKRCLSRDEITALLEASPKQWKTLFTTLVFTGLRISEALALTWEDVTDEGLVVRESKTPAGRRTVMLIPSVRRLLNEQRLSQAPGCQVVFAAQDGAPQRRRAALDALHTTCGKAGIPKYTLHELRHTFASILIAQGELPTLVSKQMGHTDPSVTMSTYAHLFEEQASVGEATERLEAAMGGLL